MRALRATTRTAAVNNQRRAFVTASPLRAHQGYGDGKGDPFAEHPGPAPPDVGQGSSGAATKSSFSDSMKKAASGEEQASAQSGGSRSKEAAETGSSLTGGEILDSETGTANGGEALKGLQGKNAPQPKILNQSVNSVKAGLTDEQKREVERHNEEFEKRHDKAESAPQDKVDKKFWSGV